MVTLRASGGSRGPRRRPGGSEKGTQSLACSNPGRPLFPQITAQQIAAQGQPQKVTYATQPALKTQFLTTPISQAQKLAGTQQVQTQIQVSSGEPEGWEQTRRALGGRAGDAANQRPMESVVGPCSVAGGPRSGPAAVAGSAVRLLQGSW